MGQLVNLVLATQVIVDMQSQVYKYLLCYFLIFLGSVLSFKMYCNVLEQLKLHELSIHLLYQSYISWEAQWPHG